MIIHLACSLNNAGVSFVQTIRQVAAENGATLAFDAAEAIAQIEPETDDPMDWEAIVDAEIAAIRRSDIVILEASTSDYLQGYETAVALEHKKPVLIVYQGAEQQGYKGVRHRMLTLRLYQTEKELADIVEQFIKDNTITTKDLRFNMFIDRPIHNYLRSVSDETGKNKSEIIRDLINREIEKKD